MKRGNTDVSMYCTRPTKQQRREMPTRPKRKHRASDQSIDWTTSKRRATSGHAPAVAAACAAACAARAPMFATATTMMGQIDERNAIRRTLDAQYHSQRVKALCTQAVRFNEETRRTHAALLEARARIQQLEQEYATLRTNYEALLAIVHEHARTHHCVAMTPDMDVGVHRPIVSKG